MFLYIKTNILRGYGIFKNDFAHPREPANAHPSFFAHLPHLAPSGGVFKASRLNCNPLQLKMTDTHIIVERFYAAQK